MCVSNVGCGYKHPRIHTAQFSFHTGSWSQQCLVGTHEDEGRDRKPQIRTEAVYIASHIPDCPCTCLVHPRVKWSDAPGPWTTVVHVNKSPNTVITGAFELTHTDSLSAGEIKLKEPKVQFCPGDLLQFM